MTQGISDLESAPENQQSLRLMYAGTRLHGAVADIGCNSGFLLDHLEDGIARGRITAYVGVEGSKELLDKARRRGAQMRKMKQAFKSFPLAFMQTDIEKKGLNHFAEGQFDSVFMGEVLEHVKDQPAVLHEIWRMLKPGGLAIITTPWNISGIPEAVANVDHTKELTFKEMYAMMVESGFKVVRAQIVSQNWQRWGRLLMVIEGKAQK